MVGAIGGLLLIGAFVACGLSGVAYLLAARRPAEEIAWRGLGRGAWLAMTACASVASWMLLYLILTHQFQYAYVYQYTSLALPWHYLASSFWAGQEGSFLLWILYTAVIGLVLRRTGGSFEAPVMAVVALCQFFLLSMIAGIHFGDATLGSSPFSLLAEKFPEAPVFQQQPGFVPADGNGLNDLLQNPWMTIHPPTLFVGFAALLVPFAYAVAALWQRRYTEWVRPALPWSIFGVMVLGIGIVLGGYWAYVTLSFGGYWAWDPVENSSFVPWLTGIAALHTMIMQRKGRTAYRAALALNLLTFVLVVYSTFLTRSGILGDISVHSFVDLGLHLQLTLWLGGLAGLGFGLFAYRYQALPRSAGESDPLSREFLIFSGAVLLCATAAVILVGTSAPILGRIFRDSPSAVPLAFYNKWTLPLSVGFTFLAGLGQLFWWRKMSVRNLNKVLLPPLGAALVGTLGVLVFTPFVQRTAGAAAEASEAQAAGLLGGAGVFLESYGSSLLLLLLVFVSLFALAGNALVLWRIGRGNSRLVGGALSHVGMAVCMLGIISSSGFSNRLQAAQSGAEAGGNLVLNRGEPRTANGYTITYAGTEPTAEGRTAYVLHFRDAASREFTLKPVVYRSEKEQWIQHPDIQYFLEQDLYAAVSPKAMFDSPQAAPAEPGRLTLARGDSALTEGGAYTIRFAGFDTAVDPAVVGAPNVEIAVAAVLEVRENATGRTETVRPIYAILSDRNVRPVPAGVEAWGLSFAFVGMNVNTGEISLALEGAAPAVEDWIVVQAYEKPLINLLWGGLFLLTLGFGFSFYRRISEARRRAAPLVAA